MLNLYRFTYKCVAYGIHTSFSSVFMWISIVSVFQKSHSFHKYVWSACYLPGSIWSAMIQQVLKQISWLPEVFILMGALR